MILGIVSEKTHCAVLKSKLPGHLTCDGAKFDGDGRTALNAQGIEVGHSVTFNDVTAIGSVEVNSAKIDAWCRLIAT